MIKEIKGFDGLLELARKVKDWFLVSAIVYIRVSTEEQSEEGFSLDAQRKYLLAYAEKIGKKHVLVVEEKETARKVGRSQFGKIIEFFDRSKKGCCPELIVEKLDRLSRNHGDAATVYRLLNEKALKVHFAKENQILSNESKSAEILLFDMKFAMSKFFSNNLSEETKKGMTEKAHQGMYPSCAPIGYKNMVDSSGKTIITPDPERAPLIRRLFEWYDSGNYSLDAIKKMAAEHGLTSPRSGRHLNKSSIAEALDRLTYTGNFIWNGKEHQGAYKPIISRELYDRVQERLHGKTSPQKRRRKNRFPFQGLFKCGNCGCAITGDGPKKGRYIYYHCTDNSGKCPNKGKGVRQELIEAQVLASLRALRIDRDILDWIISSLRHDHAAETRVHQEAIKQFEKQKVRLEKQKEKLADLLLDDRIDPEIYDSRREKIRMDLDEINKQIEAHRAASPENLEDGIKLLELMQVAETLYKNQTMDEKRKLIQIIYSNSILDKRKLQLNYKKPFDLLVVTNSKYQQKKAASGGGSGLRPIWLPNPDSNQGQGG